MRGTYDQLLREGEVGIDRLITSQAQETLEIDFKRKEVDRHGEFTTKDRQMLAEALSGFANSAGGLLVVGVDARPGADGIDCAQAARPIADIRRFFSDANTEVGRLTQPRLDGVIVGMIESQRSPGAGYLLVYIERSERRPHRSEAKNQKSYFKRAGASFFEMEHYDIADAFARVTVPRLAISFQQAHVDERDAQMYVLFSVILTNISDVVAKYPFAAFDNMHGVGIYQSHLSPNRYRVYSHMREGSLTGGADDVLHPGTRVDIGKIAVVLNRQPGGRWAIMDERSQRDNPTFAFHFGCEGMRSERGEWTIDRRQLPVPC